MKFELIEKIVNVLLNLLRLLVSEREQENDREATANRELAEAVRNNHAGLTDAEIIDRV